MTKDCHKGNNCHKAFKGLYKTKQLRNHILTHLTLISHIISTSKTFIDFIGTVSNQVQSIIICFKNFCWYSTMLHLSSYQRKGIFQKFSAVQWTCCVRGVLCELQEFSWSSLCLTGPSKWNSSLQSWLQCLITMLLLRNSWRHAHQKAWYLMVF